MPASLAGPDKCCTSLSAELSGSCSYLSSDWLLVGFVCTAGFAKNGSVPPKKEFSLSFAKKAWFSMWSLMTRLVSAALAFAA